MSDKTHYRNLKRFLETRNQNTKKRLVSKHKEAFLWISNNTKQIAAGAFGSLLLLSSPAVKFLPDNATQKVHEKFLQVPDNMFMLSDLRQYLPNKVGELLPQEENKIAGILSSYYGLDVKTEINGFRLHNTYGYIGAEQHLKLYPGDNIEQHFTNPYYADAFISSGMAPGIGAFGYFTQSKNTLTQKDIDREKYYIAVQTFLAKDYAIHITEYRNFFKFRKMLVVNPNNGLAVIADIADSGPAVWTGKQLGGSPEVMKYLERVDGAMKGPVLYFFIDDPTDIVPLGPIEVKKTNL